MLTTCLAGSRWTQPWISGLLKARFKMKCMTQIGDRNKNMGGGRTGGGDATLADVSCSQSWIFFLFSFFLGGGEREGRKGEGVDQRKHSLYFFSSQSDHFKISTYLITISTSFFFSFFFLPRSWLLSFLVASTYVAASTCCPVIF